MPQCHSSAMSSNECSFEWLHTFIIKKSFIGTKLNLFYIFCQSIVCMAILQIVYHCKDSKNLQIPILDSIA